MHLARFLPKISNPTPPAHVPLPDAAGAEGGERQLECTSACAPPAGVQAAPPSDEELFLRVRTGDREGLAALVRRYESGLFALLVRMTGGDTHRADDLFQETFLRAVRAAGTFETGKPFRPWLTAIAVNLVRDDARKRKLRGEVALDGGADDASRVPESPGETPEASAAREDEAAGVRRALGRLTEKEREVVLLHFYDGMTLAEAAAALEIPLGTVKSRLHGALVRLKAFLGG